VFVCVSAQIAIAPEKLITLASLVAPRLVRVRVRVCVYRACARGVGRGK
jgi:hypothetical protein